LIAQISNCSYLPKPKTALCENINFKQFQTALIFPNRAPGVNKILPDLSLRKFKTAPLLYLGAEAPYLYNVALGFG